MVPAMPHVRVTWGYAGIGGLTVVFLALSGALALVDWWAVFAYTRKRRVAELVAKPGMVVALGCAAVSMPVAVTAMRFWFLAALGCCLVGDVALMLPGDRSAAFGAGLGAFLVAQACFIAGLLHARGARAVALGAACTLAAAAAWPAGRIILSIVRRGHVAFAAPVAVYMGALLAMAAIAWSSALGRHAPASGAVLAGGASLFVASDTVLAADRFVRRLPHAKLLVHVTYHLAIAGLVLSLAGHAVVVLQSPGFQS